VTPTGALIATTFATSFGRCPPCRSSVSATARATATIPTTPNVLRVLIGRETAGLTAGTTSAADATEVVPAFRPAGASGEAERVTVIECEIDDMNPQIFGVVMDRLYADGALEVFYIPVQMEENRPGTLLTVVARPAERARMTDIISGKRRRSGCGTTIVDRECLQRGVITSAPRSARCGSRCRVP
jgi:uncharacterized protein (DUF111 family)